MKSGWAWPDHITCLNNVIKIAGIIACMLTPRGRAVTPALRAQYGAPRFTGNFGRVELLSLSPACLACLFPRSCRGNSSYWPPAFRRAGLQNPPFFHLFSGPPFCRPFAHFSPTSAPTRPPTAVFGLPFGLPFASFFLLFPMP